MHMRKIVSTVLFGSALVGVLLCAACAPGPTPVAFDLKAALDRYYSSLPEGWGAIAPAALNEQLQSAKPFLVDVREPKEIADAGFIAGSINLPIRTFVKNLDKLPAKNQAIVVVCGSGHRSAMAMQALQMLGYTNVKSLASGFSAWKAANLPFVTGAPPDAKAGIVPEVDKDLLAALDNYLGHLPDGWNTIAPAILNDLLKTSQPFQLEVRDQKEVAEAGSIANATHIPIRTLIKNLDKLPPDKGATIIAECSSGHRSAMTMMTLGMLGYSNARSLAGGFAAWTKLGLPVSK